MATHKKSPTSWIKLEWLALSNVVPAEWLAQARANVEDRLVNHGERDHFIRSPEGEEHSATEAFIGSALRVIAGPRGEGDAFWFHYDASVVTMVVPIFMPDAERGNSGELVGLFNKRPFGVSFLPT